MTNTPTNTTQVVTDTTLVAMEGWHGVFIDGKDDPIATFDDPAPAERYAFALATQGIKASVKPFVLDITEVRPARIEDRMLANQEAALEQARETTDLLPDPLERAVLAAVQGLTAAGTMDPKFIAAQAVEIGKAVIAAIDKHYEAACEALVS